MAEIRSKINEEPLVLPVRSFFLFLSLALHLPFLISRMNIDHVPLSLSSGIQFELKFIKINLVKESN